MSSLRNTFVLLTALGLSAFGANDIHENLLRTDKFTPVHMHGKTTAIRGVMMHDRARQRYISAHHEYTSGEGCFTLEINDAGEATFSFPDPLPAPYIENPGENIFLEVTIDPLPPSKTLRSTGRVRFDKGNIRLSNGLKFNPSPEWQKFDYQGGAFTICLTPAPGAKISLADFKMVPVYPEVGGYIVLPDGGTLKRFVLPEGADFVTRWGVSMWRGWLWKLTGVALPIETVSDAKPSEGDFTPIRDTSLKRGWQLNVTKSGIVLKYNENDDIASALFDYLRMGMGYAHYAPGCEKLPKLPVASLPAIDRRAIPRYDAILHSSNYQLRSGGKIRVNRLMHGETDYYHTPGPQWDHAMNILLPQELYFKEHPEFYMMNASGTRQVSKEVYQTQQCFSSREARDIILESIANYAKARNGVSRICLEPGDSAVACQCPKCLEFNGGSKSDNTDLLMDFSNEIAATLKSVGSDMVFRRAAYLNRCNPPKKIKVADNIDIFYCLTEHLLPCTLHVDCERNREKLKLAAEWNRALNNDPSRLGFMTYDDARPLQLVRLFDYLNKYGSGDIYMFQWHYTPYSVQFVIPRWNLGEDADKLVDEFDHYYYGKAGDAMHKLTLFIDDYAKNYRHGDGEGRLTVLFCGEPRHARSVFSREAFDKMYAILDEAIAAADGDKTLRARIFEQKKLIVAEDFLRYGPTTVTSVAEMDAFIKRLTDFIAMAREAPGKFWGVSTNDMRFYLLTTTSLDIPNTGKFWANEPYVDNFLAAPKSFFADADRIQGGWYFKPLSMKGTEPPALYSYECPARICAGIRRAGHANSSATLTLPLKTAPARPSFLSIEGQDDDKFGTSEMRVTVNGSEIFSGPCKFPERAWGRMGLNIPAGILKQGENKIVIENITKDFPSRSALFDDPKAAANDLQWGWIALSEAYWLDPNSEFTRYINGDFSTTWCYNDGNTRSAPSTGIQDGKAIITSNEGPTYYYSHKIPKLAITPGDKVKFTVKASGSGNIRVGLWNYRPYRHPSNEQIIPSGFAGADVGMLPKTNSEPFTLTKTPKEFTCILTPAKGTGFFIPHAFADKGSTVELFDLSVELIHQ